MPTVGTNVRPTLSQRQMPTVGSNVGTMLPQRMNRMFVSTLAQYM